MSFIHIALNLQTVLLLTLFAAGSLSCSITHLQITKAAKWLFKHKNQTWIELGKPGTFWFKGAAENPLIRRISAWQSLRSEMLNNRSLSKFPDPELAKIIQRFQRWRKISKTLILSFVASVFLLAFLNS